MMKYEIFKDVVENAVLDYLPPEFQNSELHLQRVKKVNGMDENEDFIMQIGLAGKEKNE